MTFFSSFHIFNTYKILCSSCKMTEIKEIVVIVKWSGKEYPVTDLTDQDTVEVLRHEIFRKTQVRPERQKLLNLKYKGKNVE